MLLITFLWKSPNLSLVKNSTYSLYNETEICKQESISFRVKCFLFNIFVNVLVDTNVGQKYKSLVEIFANLCQLRSSQTLNLVYITHYTVYIIFFMLLLYFKIIPRAYNSSIGVTKNYNGQCFATGVLAYRN